jgi:ABC-type polar amino acid transport system ATPase subunit
MMAQKYVEIGMVMTAVQLFERLNMQTDVVECLMMANRNKEAKEKALA